MSKMPAKKKSCFQITSVTQAQVAAIGAADDTESLDDPDESRTEDMSSEIYDMPRAEYEPTCDRSSSEEALNNVGEHDAVSVAPSHVPEASQLSALSANPTGEFQKVGVSVSTHGQQPPGIGVTAGLPLITQPGAMQQQPVCSVSVNTSQPAAVTSSAPPPSTSTVSCTSRFRVIKLDHGTGEPFRRGRWMCTEFYDKDSEGTVVSRTVDSIRHSSTTLESADRDSGVGLTGGSVVAPATHSGQGLGSIADASLSSHRMHLMETLAQQQQIQNYSARQQGVSGSTTQSAFASGKPTAVPAQPTVGVLQSSGPQTMLPVGQNGLPQSGIHIQKSPIIPPSSQPIVYPPQQQQQQIPMGHHLTGQLPGLIQNQTEYYQQQQLATMQPGLSTGQSLPVSSLSAGLQPVGQGPAPVLPSAVIGTSVSSQVADVGGGGSVPTGQAVPGLLQQQALGMGAVGASILVGSSNLQQQTVSQYAAAGALQPHVLHPTSSGVQNVPAIAVSSSVSTTVPTAVPSASSVTMPNVTTSSLPPAQIVHNKTPVALGVQGLPATGFGQVESGGGRKSEGLVNAQSPVVSGKEPVKPFIPESLQLTTPTVNSLFGIHIPVDGEEDRNPSKAFYQAFQSGGRLRDSKANSDRYSTILEWTGQACKSVTMCVQCAVAVGFAFFTCMDLIWKQSLAASGGLAKRLFNNILIFSLCLSLVLSLTQTHSAMLYVIRATIVISLFCLRSACDFPWFGHISKVSFTCFNCRNPQGRKKTIQRSQILQATQVRQGNGV